MKHIFTCFVLLLLVCSFFTYAQDGDVVLGEDLEIPFVHESVESDSYILNILDVLTWWFDPVFEQPLKSAPIISRLYPRYKGALKGITIATIVYVSIKNAHIQKLYQAIKSWYNKWMYETEQDIEKEFEYTSEEQSETLLLF